MKYFIHYFLTIVIISSLLSRCANDDNTLSSLPDVTQDTTISVSLVSPTDQQSFHNDESITFNGTATHTGNNQIVGKNLAWFSNKDGMIGLGNFFDRSGLSVDSHDVILKATNPSGRVNFDTIQIIVLPNLNKLNVILKNPIAGKEFFSHEILTLEGSAIDEFNTVVSEKLSFEWSSSNDGILGNGYRSAPGGLTQGSHTIALSVSVENTTGQLLASSAFVEIFIKPDDSKGAVAFIIEPQSNSVFPLNTAITFTGAAQESNGDYITGPALVWTSSMDGIIGIGETCVVSNLSLGFHRITMSVNVLSGGKVTKSILLKISS